MPLFSHLFLRLPGPGVGNAEWVSLLQREAAFRSRRGEGLRRPLRSFFVSAGARSGDAGLAGHLRSVLEPWGPGVLSGGGDPRMGGTAGEPTEWTLEVEVESARGQGREGACLTPEVAREWRKWGVNRLSLAFSAPVRWRGEGLAALHHAVGAGREAGLPALSVELPVEIWKEERDVASALPDLLQAGVGEVALWEGEEEEDRRGWVQANGWLRARGFRSGDGVHFHRGRRAALHPRAILGREPVMGLGPGSVTFRNPIRRWNVREWKAYRRTLDEGGIPEEGWERLSREDARVERVWSRLRKSRGLPLKALGPSAQAVVGKWEEAGWATVGGARVVLTETGWIRADGLSVELLAAMDVDGGEGAR